MFLFLLVGCPLNAMYRFGPVDAPLRPFGGLGPIGK
jgi:hypothetical protein